MVKKILFVLLALILALSVGCSTEPQDNGAEEEAWRAEVADIPDVALEISELNEKLPAEVPVYPEASDAIFNDYSNIEHFGADTTNHFYTVKVPNTQRVVVFDYYMELMGPYMPEGGYNHFRRNWEVPFTVGDFSAGNEGYDGSVKLVENENDTILEILIKSY